MLLHAYICHLRLHNCLYAAISGSNALMRSFPGIQHLMCYFHVVKACREQLKGIGMKEKNKVMKHLSYLHYSYSLDEFNERLQEVSEQWNVIAPQFLQYFLQQWNGNNTFKNWKVFNSDPGVASMNNAVDCPQ